MTSRVSLKVALNNGNEEPSIPVAHVVGMKETYESMNFILKGIKYSVHNWNSCGALNVVYLILGLQVGYAKICVSCLFEGQS